MPAITSEVIESGINLQPVVSALWHTTTKTARVASALLAVSQTAYVIDAGIALYNEREIAPWVGFTDSLDVCRNASFVMVDLGGTGFETQQYESRNSAEMVRKLGGCSIYLQYESEYNRHKNALALKGAVQQMTEPGKPKYLILRGNSFGWLAVNDLINSPIIQQTPEIQIVEAMGISSPSGNEDVSDAIGRPFVDSQKEDVDIPVGKVAIAISSIITGLKNGDNYFDPKVREDFWINLNKTNPKLTMSQLRRIKTGAQKIAKQPKNKVPIHYSYIYDPTGADDTVLVEQALRGSRKKMDVEIDGYPIPGARHAMSWLVHMFPKYAPTYEYILTNVAERCKRYVFPATGLPKPGR